jgi:hypothetical protein
MTRGIGERRLFGEKNNGSESNEIFGEKNREKIEIK